MDYFAISSKRCCFKDIVLKPRDLHTKVTSLMTEKLFARACYRFRISKTNPDNMTERESSRKPRKCDRLLFLCRAFCFCNELPRVSTEWPSLPVWITVTFAQQTVESLWNFSAISSHKAISKATNTELLSKHITYSCGLCKCAKSGCLLYRNAVYVLSRTAVINEKVSVHNFLLIVCQPLPGPGKPLQTPAEQIISHKTYIWILTMNLGWKDWKSSKVWRREKEMLYFRNDRPLRGSWQQFLSLLLCAVGSWIK